LCQDGEEYIILLVRPNIGGRHRAWELAESKGGVTLEKIIAERGISMPPRDVSNPAAVKAWEDISRQYAEGASGVVRAVVGLERGANQHFRYGGYTSGGVAEAVADPVPVGQVVITQ
jgi:hypothetical protein